MEISYLGHASFRIKTKSAVIVTDPYLTRTDADIVTVSHDHFDHNATDKVTGFRKIVSGPGEYEISGVSIIGITSYHDAKKGVERGKNTIYVYEAEGLRLAHLGDLGHVLDDDVLNQIGAIDILMVPVGGEYTIGPKEAAAIVSEIDPYFILPMHFQAPYLDAETFAKLEAVESFLKEMGAPVENLPKFSIKKEDIIKDQNTKIIVLQAKL